MAKKVEKHIKEFFDFLEVTGDFQITESDEQIDVVLETEDSGMIIGYHGETLESIQLLLSLVLAKKLGEFKRVSLEVGDYKKNREEWLKRLAQDAKDRAIDEQTEVRLEDLKAWERRVIHLMLSDDKEVVSESVGEGRDRALIIKPK